MQFKWANGHFCFDGFGWACRRGAGQIRAIFIIFIVAAHLNSIMAPPVTPDAAGDRGRPDDRLNADSSPSLNASAKIFEVSRYGQLCSSASVLIVESMDVLVDKSSSRARRNQAEAAMRMLAEKLADVDKALLASASNLNNTIPAAKKAIEKIRNEEARAAAGDANAFATLAKRNKKSAAHMKVEDFEITPNVAMEDAATDTTMFQLQSSAAVPSARVSPRTSMIPAPSSANGTFSPIEVLTILLGIPDQKKNFEARKIMVDKGWVKYKEGGEMKVMSERGLRNFWHKWKESHSPPPE